MPPVDEGMIHAWLDGALSADEAARIEQLVASDPAWGAAAAEARGLIAASSRILSSLDAVPANVAPASIPTVSAAREQLRTAKVAPMAPRRWRPQAWAAAATLVMAVGAGVLWQNTPASERSVLQDAKSAPTEPGAVVAAAPSATPGASMGATSTTSTAAADAAPGPSNRPAAETMVASAPAAALGGTAGARTVRATPAKPTDVTATVGAAKADRADQVAAARVATAEPTIDARRAPTLAEGASMERAKEAKKAEDVTKDAMTDLRARANEGRAVAAGAGAAAPAVAPVPSTQPAAPAAAGAVASVKERSADAPAQNALKALAAQRDEAVGASRPARRALAAAAPVTGCWTVRLTQYTPSPSFAVPVGVLLDSVHTGSAQVARALVGSDAPTPAPGVWTASGDSLRITIDRAVLGYTLRAVVSVQSRLGSATLGDVNTPAKASAQAELQPSRCPAP